MFNIWSLGITGLAAAFLFGAGYSLVSGMRGDALELENLRNLNRVQASKLSGAYMRIERRDNAIAALPTQCRDLAQRYVRTGDVPVFKNPFEMDR